MSSISNSIISSVPIELVEQPSSFFSQTLPFITAIVGIILGGYISYLFAVKLEKKKNEINEQKEKRVFIINQQQSFLNNAHQFLKDINMIIMKLVGINNLGQLIFKSDFQVFDINDDFFDIMTKQIIPLENIVISNKPNLNSKFSELILEEIEYLKDYRLFQEIGLKLDISVVNHQFFIGEDLLNEFIQVRDMLVNATMNGMKDFHINSYKQKIIDFNHKLTAKIKENVKMTE